MNRKGISPLIAAVLLIAFTMAVATILTAFVTTFTKRQTSAIGNRSEQQIRCSYGGLDIYDAAWNDPNVVVTVANTGTIDLGRINVQAFNESGVMATGNIASLPTGGVESVNINTGSKPNKVRAVSVSCPAVSDEETRIKG